MLQHDGRELVMKALLGYSYGNLDDMREMILHPNAVLGLSDGGAHCGVICDASIPTFMLTHWTRDRDRGERLPLELVVQKQTRDTAALYGLGDRGVVAPGYRADLNVIDYDALSLALPELVHDLPGGARRLIQRADGYRSTFVAGVETMRDGEETGARPGQARAGHAMSPTPTCRAAATCCSQTPPVARERVTAGEDPGVAVHVARSSSSAR